MLKFKIDFYFYKSKINKFIKIRDKQKNDLKLLKCINITRKGFKFFTTKNIDFRILITKMFTVYDLLKYIY